MAHFFIHRPVLAWVIAIFIVIAGLVALPSIPVAQYPSVAPPQISVSTFYVGASPEEIHRSVAQPIDAVAKAIIDIAVRLVENEHTPHADDISFRQRLLQPRLVRDGSAAEL